jgi:hypothetical protein
MHSFTLWIDNKLYRVWFKDGYIRYEGMGRYVVNGTKVLEQKC